MNVTITVESERRRVRAGGRYRTRTYVDGPAVYVDGDTDAEARAQLADMLGWYLRQDVIPHVESFGGYTSVRYATPYGWSTVVTGPGCGRCHSAGGREHADVAAAEQRYLLVQQATADWCDDEEVRAGWDYLCRRWVPKSVTDFRPEDHLAYAGWQRAYRAAEAQGQADPHEWAGRHQGEYTPRFPRPAAT